MDPSSLTDPMPESAIESLPDSARVAALFGVFWALPSTGQSILAVILEGLTAFCSSSLDGGALSLTTRRLELGVKRLSLGLGVCSASMETDLMTRLGPE